ncbi:hypothetical protein [Chitinophaga qingshengii]|uniref:Uncharacterized protein n=1 Tax=Chitinophaga qingshengii TaxID=1569794 RepID=A0ABR7TX97_9BACT|nr:hypothetical protein [Chitinophaga qingshengii]MBC9934019.1 hypothetical protein [Chitinophaga qingshengii]
MKKFLCVLLLAAITAVVNAQTPSPTRAYWTNIDIPGNTGDAQGPAYILLHPSYDNAIIHGGFVMGKITGIRGHEGAWNRKWTVEVNTATAYNSDRGSVVSYNEPASLVTLRHNGVKYLAVTITNSSTLGEFAFTGWVQGPTLKLVTAYEVTEVLPFEHYDPVSAPGGVVVGDADLHPFSYPLDKNAIIVNTAKTGGLAITVPTSQQNIFTGGHHIACFSPKFKGGLGISIGQDNSGFIQALAESTENGTLYLNPNGGNVGIGVQDTKGYRLAVAGNVIAERITVKNHQSWPDYVFTKDYHLPTLQEVAAYIAQHQHLPDMPSAETVKEKGIDLEEMNSKLLRKVEELTLHLIRLDQENKELKAEVKAIRADLQHK